MAISTPVLMFFEEISVLILSLETIFASVNQNSSCWQSVICHIANDAFLYSKIFQKNTNLRSQVELLESVDEQLVQAQNQAQQSIGKKRVYKLNIQNLTEQLRQVHVNDTLGIFCVAKSATHSNAEKFNGDKTKLEAFFAQFNLKLQHNIDHFT